MSGLLAHGVHIPAYRARIGKSVRSVASYDEDSTTMGVEAARQALRGTTAANVYFATTAPAYADKTNASAIHAALDLGRDGFAVDIAGSARGAVGALRAAAATGGLAVLSDIRTGKPGSADEREGGDGAAAFLFGEGETIAEVLSEVSLTAEFLDRWRTPGSLFSQSWEERFGQEQYTPLIKEAAARALQAAGIEKADRVVISSPHTRTAAAARKSYGAAAGPDLGYAGAADAGIQLAGQLDQAAGGETILVISAVDGCDAMVLKTVGAAPLGRQSPSAREIDYTTFLAWRGVIEKDTPRRPEPDRPAAPPSARTEAWKFAFVGSKCQNCGQVALPPTRVCAGCRAVDRMQRIRLADSPGTVATFTVDRLAYSPSPPVIDTVVDFDEGGRYTLEMTDAGPDEVTIGTRVETTFRRLYTTGGVHNYFWKVRPVSDGQQRDS